MNEQTRRGAARYRSRILGVASAAVMVLSGGVALASTAGAEEAARQPGEITVQGGCGAIFNPTVPGAKAHWELTCKGGVITIEGNVIDTKADGKCARVSATMPNGDVLKSAAACPKGDKETYKWSGRGTKINAKLYTYAV